ncbi:MAG: OmpA family protein [Bacteroides sp.]|nr:OmpA family protein [Prevotella sp.]MCM1407760.1 OmpA family protein [Treponema brennaborense]MCM1469090.1 OmpA family protein [Bacteroides sp.]
MLRIRKTSIVCLICFFPLFLPMTSGKCLLPVLPAETFRFKYAAGENYRILSTVQENVFVNKQFNHYAEIVNRIAVKVTAAQNGTGTHEAVFMTTENAVSGGTQNTFTWGTEYKSVFDRDQFGTYAISDEYFMPVVRNVPIFPDRDIAEGDTWSAEGEEAHDLRRTFGIEKPFKVPFTANYAYQGRQKIDGKNLHVIKARYTLSFNSPVIPADALQLGDYPASTMGYSDQTLYWDNEAGALHSYNENFRIVITTAAGNVLEFRGTAQAETSGQKQVGTEETARKIQAQLENMGIENASVSAGEAGLTISLENIQFEADSAVLSEREKRKIGKIADILKQFPDNDLLISGHTALAGTASARKKLSKERADAVASFLVQIGVKDMYHVFSQGFGAEKPIAPNDTEDGRARNRRVEITILQ